MTDKLNIKFEILKYLLNKESCSRADIAAGLKLSKPAVSDNVSKLLDLGIVKEIGKGGVRNSSGKRPILLELVKSFKYIVVIDISFVNPVCAVGNLKYEMIDSSSINVGDIGSTERKALVYQVILDLLKKHKIAQIQVGAIIISTPGIIGSDGEYFFANAQFSKWTDIGLKQYLSERFMTPILLQNDVNMALTAEMALGHGKEYNNLVYISCGMGLGSSIALNRIIYAGEHYAAGEVGYFINESSVKKGITIEDEVSLNAILKKIKKDIECGKETILSRLAVNTEELQLSHLAAAYNMKDPYIRSVFSDYIGTKLGTAIYNIVSLLDINIVIFGGEYSVFFEEMFKGINKILKNLKYIQPKVKKTKLDTLGGLYGGLVTGTIVALNEIVK